MKGAPKIGAHIVHFLPLTEIGGRRIFPLRRAQCAKRSAGSAGHLGAGGAARGAAARQALGAGAGPRDGKREGVVEKTSRKMKVVIFCSLAATGQVFFVVVSTLKWQFCASFCLVGMGKGSAKGLQNHFGCLP